MQTKIRQRVHRRVARRYENEVARSIMSIATVKLFDGMKTPSELRTRWQQIAQDDAFWKSLLTVHEAMKHQDIVAKEFAKQCDRIQKRPLQ